jgi:hypothetical protein
MDAAVSCRPHHDAWDPSEPPEGAPAMRSIDSATPSSETTKVSPSLASCFKVARAPGSSRRLRWTGCPRSGSSASGQERTRTSFEFPTTNVTPTLLRPFLSSRAISTGRETVRRSVKSKLPTSGLLSTVAGHADARSAPEKENRRRAGRGVDGADQEGVSETRGQELPPRAPPLPFPCGITTSPPSGRGRIYPAPYRPDLRYRCSGQRAGAGARRGRPCPPRWRCW